MPPMMARFACAALAGLVLMGACATESKIQGDPPGQIAFTSTRGGETEIYVMPADGSAQPRLLAGEEGFGQVDTYGGAASPSHDRLAYTGPLGVYIVDVASLDSALVAPLGVEVLLSWSPDGDQLVFDDLRGDDLSLYVLSLDGPTERRLTDGSRDDFDATWSPDGRLIAYTSCADFVDECGVVTGMELIVISEDGTGRRLLAGEGVFSEGPASWSPDGSRLAFTSCYGVDCQGAQISVINADGTGRTVLTQSSDHFDFAPNWSPDGKRIAFECGSGICTVNSDGSERRQLTSGAFDSSLTWSPDGQWLAFESDRDRPEDSISVNDIYIIKADGTTMRRLTTNVADDSGPIWLNVP